MQIVYFFVGLVVGAIVGALVYRNNAKKIEREARQKVDSMKYELDRLRRMAAGGKR